MIKVISLKEIVPLFQNAEVKRIFDCPTALERSIQTKLAFGPNTYLVYRPGKNMWVVAYERTTKKRIEKAITTLLGA